MATLTVPRTWGGTLIIEYTPGVIVAPPPPTTPNSAVRLVCRNGITDIVSRDGLVHLVTHGSSTLKTHTSSIIKSRK